MTRKTFMRNMAFGAAAAAFPGFAAPQPAKTDEIRAILLHLGSNMWSKYSTKLRTDEAIWRKATDYLRAKGMNMVLIDVGEGVVYPSHPEIAAEDAWSPEKLKAELARLRGMGLEPIPKLNFSATHDAWLKDYQRMVSTKKYYQVCQDVIADLAEIFGHPRFFHLGYDEETANHQSGQEYVVVRRGELWWHDFLWFIKTTENAGMRPWIWSDYGWHHPEFISRCPKSVLQSNWYYDEDGEGFDLSTVKKPYLKLYLELDKAGFDQIPGGSNWASSYWRNKGHATNKTSIGGLVKFCREHIRPEFRKGFLMGSWVQCETEKDYSAIEEGIDLFAAALNQ
ncbi:MAG: Tat pathway signal protein [Kiritimatiellae bacterium]|nr:Tat pathway signal protein [Kiritimatiellia bacterium]